MYQDTKNRKTNTHIGLLFKKGGKNIINPNFLLQTGTYSWESVLPLPGGSTESPLMEIKKEAEAKEVMMQKIDLWIYFLTQSTISTLLLHPCYFFINLSHYKTKVPNNPDMTTTFCTSQVNLAKPE